jgi:hypothetical protein
MATEQTPQGTQILLGDVAPITQRDRIEARARRPMTGGNRPPPAGGLFDADARAQPDIFDTAPGATMSRPPEPYQYLPTFAKMAIEQLDADSSLRNATMLNLLLDFYAESNGTAPDSHTRESAQHICRRRFGETFHD